MTEPEGDERLENHLRRTLRAVADATPRPITPFTERRRRPTRRWVTPAAAASLLVAGTAGLLIVGLRDDATGTGEEVPAASVADALAPARSSPRQGGAAITTDDAMAIVDAARSYPWLQREIDERLDAETAACMAEQGQPYPANEGGRSTLSAASTNPRAKWVRLDPARASEFGFVPGHEDQLSAGRMTDFEPPQGDDELAAFHNALMGGPRERQEVALNDVLTGAHVGSVTHDGGCRRVADLAVFGDLATKTAFYEAETTLEALQAEVDQRARSSTDFRQAQAAWAACFNERGLTPEPVEAVDDLLAIDWPDPRPSSSEVAAAELHIQCVRQTQLGQRGVDAEIAATQALLQQHTDKIESITQPIEAVTQRLQ